MPRTKTKAELLQEIKLLKDACAVMTDSMEAWKASAERHKQELELVKRQLADAQLEGADHKKAFLEEQAAKRQARELFARQAHLAGELAKLVTNTQLKNA